MKIHCFDIMWDTDGEDPAALGLPERFTVEVDDESDPDDISLAADTLSDTFGFCVLSLYTDVEVS